MTAERLVLTDPERDEVAAIVDATMVPGESWDPMSVVGSATRHAQRLPLRLRRFLCWVRENETDVAVVSNLPIDPDLPSTPTGWDDAVKTGAGLYEELVLLLVGAGLAEPFGWADQQDGRVVHDVCPAPGQETAMTSASSETALSLHTEDVHHACRGDYVSLYCLRNPDAVGTTLVRVDDLDLPPELRRSLRRPEFVFHADDSHTAGSPSALGGHLDGRPHECGAVLFGPDERPYLRFDIDFMSAVAGAERAAEAIAGTQRLFADALTRVVLDPGDLVFVDNYRVVHGRDPFTPRYDGGDRWLKRLNLIRDVRRIYAGGRRRNRIIA